VQGIIELVRKSVLWIHQKLTNLNVIKRLNSCAKKIEIAILATILYLWSHNHSLWRNTWRKTLKKNISPAKLHHFLPGIHFSFEKPIFCETKKSHSYYREKKSSSYFLPTIFAKIFPPSQSRQSTILGHIIYTSRALFSKNMPSSLQSLLSSSKLVVQVV